MDGEVHDENAWIMGGVAGHAGLFATGRQVWQFAQGLLEGLRGRSWLVSTLTARTFTTYLAAVPLAALAIVGAAGALLPRAELRGRSREVSA